MHRFRGESHHFEVTEHPDKYTIQGDVPGVLREHLTLHALNQHTLSVDSLDRSAQKNRDGERTLSSSSSLEKSPMTTEPSLAEQCSTDPFDVDKIDAKREEDSIVGTERTEDLDDPDGNYIDPLCRYKKHEDAKDLTASPSVSTTRQDSFDSHRHQFHRTFHFADTINIEKINASINSGILHVEVPKA